MTNRQWLLEKIQKMSDEELADLREMHDFICTKVENCKENNDDCEKCKLNWLKAEHKELIKLSDAERVILENIDKKFKWITRDGDGSLYVSKIKPSKDYEIWRDGDSEPFVSYNHLFQFIKWEDENPYNIEELLK